MTLEDFLSPLRHRFIETFGDCHPQSFFHSVDKHLEIEGLPDLEHAKLAIFGVLEDRASHNPGAAQGPDEVREYLYRLFPGQWSGKIVDLGNIYAGETPRDTYVAVSEVCATLIKQQIIPVVLGGSQDITYGCYRAYDQLEQTVNLVSVDARIDLGSQESKTTTAENYLSHVVLQQPYILFNYANLGHQTYFVNQEELALLDRMYFDAVRLGELRNNIRETEPYFRDADLVSFDIGAIRQSDASGNAFHSPNGFSGEEACGLARYAGISDKVTNFGVYEYNPTKDRDGRTAHLIAQMVWYFIEGVHSRKGDYPFASKADYEKYTVLINEGEHELIFYRSPLSGRWWIEVPMNDGNQLKSERHKLIPCSYYDYTEAAKNEIPARWWQAMKKAL